jgi:integrase
MTELVSGARRTRSRYPNIWWRETKNGRGYEISFRDASGRRRWRRVPGFDDVDAAVAALAEAQGKARKGERVAPAGVRFGEVAERYLESRQFTRLGGWTQKNYRAVLDRDVLPRFAHVKIAAVDTAMITAFVGELERLQKRNGSEGRLRRSTIESALGPMRGVFRQAVREGLLSASPFSMLDRDDRPAADEEPHEPHEWTDEEIEALLAASAARSGRPESRYDYTSLLTVAVRAGLRLGELLGLDWPDLELVKGAGAVNVRRQWTRLRELAPPKAGSRRRVPIPNELVRMLLELKIAAPDKTGPVFASRTGGRLAHRNVQRRGFDVAAEDAGIEGVTFHDLRHAYGSRLASKGLTARQIADAMGHKRTSTTELYIQRFNGDQADERIREAMSG